MPPQHTRRYWRLASVAIAILLLRNGAAGQTPRLLKEYSAVAATGQTHGVTLSETPDLATPIRCFINGVPLRSGLDFQVVGQNLTFLSESAPSQGDSIFVYYAPAPPGSRTVSTPFVPETVLIQTDAGAKSKHDGVALLLAQSAPVILVPTPSRAAPAKVDATTPTVITLAERTRALIPNTTSSPRKAQLIPSLHGSNTKQRTQGGAAAPRNATVVSVRTLRERIDPSDGK